ncbi:hypothetical protein [Nitrospira sp. Nam74]
MMSHEHFLIVLAITLAIDILGIVFGIYFAAQAFKAFTEMHRVQCSLPS